MHHFFVGNDRIREEHIIISGDDYHHAARVLRLHAGEEVSVSDEDGTDYRCEVEEIVPSEEQVRLLIREKEAESRELPARVWLFQGLPKADKLEWIIQKATELGVTDIVPVGMKNCVARLDESKAGAKQKRWQAIAESAAKQAKRSRIPTVHGLVRFTDAVRMTESFPVRILPYENEDGVGSLCEAIVSLLPGQDTAVMIGPEGGFDPMEVKLAENHGWKIVSLGKRILRTETAAAAALSLVMIRLEIAQEMHFDEEM